jgi:hypothetical protein
MDRLGTDGHLARWGQPGSSREVLAKEGPAEAGPSGGMTGGRVPPQQ